MVWGLGFRVGGLGFRAYISSAKFEDKFKVHT